MAQATGPDHRPLRVVHVLRAPLGGLYRHVLDLSREAGDASGDLTASNRIPLQFRALSAHRFQRQ